MSKDEGAFRTIGEVAEALALPQHVLRFWETRFPQINPLKRSGNRRYYRPDDVALLAAIRRLLYNEGYTIKGVQRLLKSSGRRAMSSLGMERSAVQEPVDAAGAQPANDGSRLAGERDGSTEKPAAEETGETATLPVPIDQLGALAAEIEACVRRLADARLAVA